MLNLPRNWALACLRPSEMLEGPRGAVPRGEGTARDWGRAGRRGQTQREAASQIRRLGRHGERTVQRDEQTPVCRQTDRPVSGFRAH